MLPVAHSHSHARDLFCWGMPEFYNMGVDACGAERGTHAGAAGPRSQAPGRHEYPRQVAYVDELPMTTTGKIIRRALRDR